MHQVIISLPIILYIFGLLKNNENKINKYLSGPCKYLEISNPIAILMTFIIIHISGISCISHYQEQYQNILHVTDSAFVILGAGKLRTMFNLFFGSMFSWKILLLQRYLVHQNGQNLLDKTLDIDGISLVSYSKKREGSELGHHKRRKGKPTFQGSASFIGKIFIDFKLFPGSTNVCTFFKKAVKRAISMGYSFSVVRADAIYGIVKNLLFLEELSLLYVIGIKTSLLSINEGVKKFENLARQKSSKIIRIASGSSILDLGFINIASVNEKPVYRHVLLCRRIHRKRKKGKMKIKKYYYGIVTNITDMTPLKLFYFYQQRQKIENGFKELQYHYHFNNLCSNKSLKVNEMWMISKIFAMTMAKLFAENILPKSLRSLRLRTLIRHLFSNSISYIKSRKVHLAPRPKHLWHLKRIFTKLGQNRFLSKPFVIMV